MGFHLIVLLIGSLFLVQCRPKIKDDLGPEFDITEVQKAIVQPVASLTPMLMKVGDHVLLNERYFVASAPMVVNSDTEILVFERGEDENNISFGILDTDQSYREGKLDLSITRQSSFSFAKSTSQPKEPSEPSKDKAPPPAEQPQTKTPKISFHNLQVSELEIDPPQPVREQPNCLGIPRCRLRATAVAVDKVIWNPEKYDRIHMSWLLSSQVPYLASVLSQCSSLVTVIAEAPGKALPLYLKICSDVVDFRYGTDTASQKVRSPKVNDVIPASWNIFDPLGRAVQWAQFPRAQDYVPVILKPQPK